MRGFRRAREGEAAALVAAVAEASGAGAPVNLSELLVTTSNKIVRRVAFGGDDVGEGSMEASAVLKETQRLLGAFWVADYVPRLGWLDALRGLRGRLERNFHQLDAFYESVIDSHLNKRASTAADDEEDLVDVLLRLHGDPAAHRGAFGSRDQIKGILTDMFIAGTDTSAATVEWTMTELVNHPDVLAKAQHEVRSVVGDGADMVREPDLGGLGYLKLVIKESMRDEAPPAGPAPGAPGDHRAVHGAGVRDTGRDAGAGEREGHRRAHRRVGPRRGAVRARAARRRRRRQRQGLQAVGGRQLRAGAVRDRAEELPRGALRDGGGGAGARQLALLL